MEMKRIISILVGVILLLPFMLDAKEANATVAKETTQKSVQKESAKGDAIKMAHELFKVMNLEKIYARIVDDATNSLIRRAPKLESVKKKIHAYYNKYIGWDAVKDEMAKIYAKYFTAKDLEELVKFYKTDLGKKTLATLPKINSEGRSLGIKRMREHQQELQEIVQKALQEKEPKEKKEAKKGK